MAEKYCNNEAGRDARRTDAIERIVVALEGILCLVKAYLYQTSPGTPVAVTPIDDEPVVSGKRDTGE